MLLYMRRLNLLVAYAAPKAQKAPTNKHIAIAFGLSFDCTPFAESGVNPGSKMENTIIDMNVPMNCGKVVKRFKIPRYMPARLSPDSS